MYPRLRLPIVLLLLPPDRRQLFDLLLRQGLPDLAHVLPTLDPGFLLGLRLLLLPGLPLRPLLDPQLLQLGQLLSLLLSCQWFLLFFFGLLKFLTLSSSNLANFSAFSSAVSGFFSSSLGFSSSCWICAPSSSVKSSSKLGSSALSKNHSTAGSVPLKPVALRARTALLLLNPMSRRAAIICSVFGILN